MIILYSDILYKIYNYSGDLFNFLIFGLSLYALYNTKFFKDEYRWFLILILCFATFEFSYYIFEYFNFKNTNFINHPYSIFVFITLSLWYSKIFKNNILNKILISFVVLFIGLNSYQIFTEKPPISSPRFYIILPALFLVLSVFLHRKLLKSTNIKNLKNEPLFWLNLGLLFLFLLKIIMKPLFDAVIPISDNLAFIIGTIKNLADPISYTLWAIGIYKLRTQPFRPISSLWP